MFDKTNSWAEICSSQLVLIKKVVIVSGVGERLREEREKKGLSQTDFGALAGVSRGTQKAYELETSHPDVRYLLALQGVDVDVHYILTGAHCLGDAAELTAEESTLIADYRQLSPSDKAGAARMVNALAAMAERSKDE